MLEPKGWVKGLFGLSSFWAKSYLVNGFLCTLALVSKDYDSNVAQILRTLIMMLIILWFMQIWVYNDMTSVLFFYSFLN